MRSGGEQDLLSVQNDNGREGEDGNGSIAFMTEVKTDLRAEPETK